MGRNGSAGAPSLGVALFVALAVLSVVAFAVTRAARSADDLVNTVVLDKTVTAGGTAEVRFTLAEPDSAVTVMIIDGRTDDEVRDLAKKADLYIIAGWRNQHIHVWMAAPDVKKIERVRD